MIIIHGPIKHSENLNSGEYLSIGFSRESDALQHVSDSICRFLDLTKRESKEKQNLDYFSYIIGMNSR
jgi:hypothetical protein